MADVKRLAMRLAVSIICCLNDCQVYLLEPIEQHLHRMQVYDQLKVTIAIKNEIK